MESYDLTRLRALIVDDNALMRRILRETLTGLGVKFVETTINGQEGVVALEAVSPDLVFVDWEMKSMSGIDFTKQVREGAVSPDPNVAIIMVSSHSDFSRIIAARDAGVHEFLVKPITVQRVYARIVSIIENPRRMIQAKSYCGPDRRRRAKENLDIKERRTRAGSAAA